MSIDRVTGNACALDVCMLLSQGTINVILAKTMHDMHQPTTNPQARPFPQHIPIRETRYFGP